jgi:hypothetical protein
MLNPLIQQTADLSVEGEQRFSELAELTNLALAGILPMLNTEKSLFCHRLHQSDAGLLQEGVSRRYTMMTLLGLHRYEQSGSQLSLDYSGILRAITSDTDWIDNAGDLGLFLWACASLEPHRLSEVIGKMRVAEALDRFPDFEQGRTMELAWYLSGLTHACLVSPEQGSSLRDCAARASQALMKNQGADGFFGHSARKNSLSGVMRGHIGSFADQVYPIYALAQYATAFGINSALESSRNCAEAICQTQGSKGQWWWHYDARRGRVFEKYPVYSVHQHGMAPMALFAAADATGKDFQPFIFRGLRWIYGKNELGHDMRDLEAKLVWRNIYPAARLTRALSRVRRRTNSRQYENPPRGLDVTWECRPYELGWLLFAFAGRENTGGLSVSGK